MRESCVHSVRSCSEKSNGTPIKFKEQYNINNRKIESFEQGSKTCLLKILKKRICRSLINKLRTKRAE